MSEASSSRSAWWWTTPALGASYFGAVVLGLALLIEPDRLAIFWPAGGLALAAFLRLPYRRWPPVLAVLWVGHVVAELLAGFPAGLGASFATIALAEVAVGAWFVRRNSADPFRLDDWHAVLTLVGWMALVAVPASATAAMVTASVFGLDAPVRLWLLWWGAQVLSDLVVAPLILTLPSTVHWWQVQSSRARLKGLTALAGLGAASLVVFPFRPSAEFWALAVLALPYPFLIWLALRVGLGGVCAASGLLCAIVVWQTLAGHGAFAAPDVDPFQRVVTIQVYLLVAVIPSLLVAATQHQAVEATERLQEIFDNSSEAIFVIGMRGADFVFEAHNPRSAAAIGRPPEELRGRRPHEVLPAPTADAVVANYRHCVASGTPITYEETLELEGGTRTWMTSLVPVRDAGRVRRLVGFARDITERNQSEQARALLEVQLREAQKMDAIGRLAGGLAHDFNNILTAIAGHAELLDADLPRQGPARESLDAIVQASQRATALVRQVLTFSRRQELPRTAVRLQTVVSEAIRLLRAAVPTTIDIEATVDDGSPPVLADTTQVHQALMNLANNAAYAMRDRPGRLTVSLEPYYADAAFAARHPPLAPGAYACLSVSDTGVGMDAATCERVFEPFFTTKPVGEGTGLGLPVVLGIMQSHGGGLAVESEPGLGTVVRLFFPAHKVGRDPTPVPAGAPPQGRGERVLFVDDETAVVAVGERVLRFLRYDPTVFSTPKEALLAFRAAPDRYSVVVTDLTMPGMTGLVLAEELRRIRSDVPIVLATGVPTAALQEQVERAGLQALLSKPFSANSLGTAVARALGRTSTVPETT